jgi:hypothetical protein
MRPRPYLGQFKSTTGYHETYIGALGVARPAAMAEAEVSEEDRKRFDQQTGCGLGPGAERTNSHWLELPRKLILGVPPFI